MKNLPIVHILLSKHSYYALMYICQFAIKQRCIPMSTFGILGYKMYDMVSKDEVDLCDYNYVRISEEVWSFGPISNGVYREIKIAMSLKKKIRFFFINEEANNIYELEGIDIQFEKNDFEGKDISILKNEIINYLE